VALIPNFSTNQTLGNPSAITITDTSTGSDGTITQRRVYLRQANGSFLVPTGTSTDYIEWDYADSSIDIDALIVDVALDVIVQWLNISNTVLYDKTSLVGFTLYNETFDYQLTQLLAANPLLVNDNNFFEHKSDLRTFIDSGNQAIELADDILAAQLCYTAATDLRLSSQYLFNANS